MIKLNEIEYKIGAHSFVYYKPGGEWIKSEMTLSEYKRYEKTLKQEKEK